MGSPYTGYTSGNYITFESRFHQYEVNFFNGTGAGSPFASYITEGKSYSGVAPFGYLKKYNHEYQHKMYAFTHDYNYLYSKPF